MDMMLEAYLTHEGIVQDDDIPHTKEPIWILGKEYHAPHNVEVIRRDIRSKLWFTYRRGFVPIGDSGITSDKGWGCMLRCGQMLLGQALVMVHLGRDWIWTPETRNKKYLRILQMFEDRRTATYSIHQIARMGVSEGKTVGEWFGPNTIAQVIKKLAVYDEWSSLAVHVALDNMIIADDVRELCKRKTPPVPKGRMSEDADVANFSRVEDAEDVRTPAQQKRWEARSKEKRKISKDSDHSEWKPLLLLIQLRLGLSEINPIYIKGLKKCFTFKQTLGVIGGKPNHALYFIGFVGDEVIYLDPHTTQPAGLVEDKEHEHEKLVDKSYHCEFASRSHILRMDPSAAVCFLCKTEEDFDSLMEQIQASLMKEDAPLFEIRYGKPLEANSSVALEDFVRQFDDSDEEFELLG